MHGVKAKPSDSYWIQYYFLGRSSVVCKFRGDDTRCSFSNLRMLIFNASLSYTETSLVSNEKILESPLLSCVHMYNSRPQSVMCLGPI